MPCVLVQLTDLHVGPRGHKPFGVDTAACLEQAVATVLRLPQRPEAVLVTGDLVNHGAPEEYEHVAELLAPLPMPVHLLPGNHDERAALRAAFPGHAYLGSEGFIQYSFRAGRLRVIALDTLVPGAPHGELCEARLAWLERELDAARGEPVAIAMHHPPFDTLIGHMDVMRLLGGAEAFARIVARHANVERILCGHVHRAVEQRFAGTIAAIAPATAHQIHFDLSTMAPAQWTLEPPAIRVIACTDAGEVVSHLVPTGSHPGPFPFGQ